ncbi:MAG TPA: hypothetical protein VMW68_08545 [Methyloceanibacter sp.]|nr:hypothetical protein [Methyloceanibacter sp.]
MPQGTLAGQAAPIGALAPQQLPPGLLAPQPLPAQRPVLPQPQGTQLPAPVLREQDVLRIILQLMAR